MEYRAMDDRLSKADRSSSEEVRFGGAQGVDPHGRSANWTALAALRFGMGSVGTGGSVGS
jgi:hypothetical protein